MAPANEKKQDSRIVFAVTKIAIEQMLEDGEQAWNSIATRAHHGWQEFLHEPMFDDYYMPEFPESYGAALESLELELDVKFKHHHAVLEVNWGMLWYEEESIRESHTDRLAEYKSYGDMLVLEQRVQTMKEWIMFNDVELWVNRWNAQMDDDLRLLKRACSEGSTRTEWFESWSNSWKPWELDNSIFLACAFRGEEQQLGYTQSVTPWRQSFYNFLVKSHMEDYNSWLRLEMRRDQVRGESREWSWEQIHARNVVDYHEWLRSEL